MFDPKNPTERQQRIEMASKQKSEHNNPCVKEQDLSYKCLAENDYNKNKCAHVFQNYLTCQTFWLKIRRDRRIKKISPELPVPKDRERIKDEYLQKLPR